MHCSTGTIIVYGHGESVSAKMCDNPKEKFPANGNIQFYINTYDKDFNKIFKDCQQSDSGLKLFSLFFFIKFLF